MLSNEKRNPLVTKLFIRGRKLNISLVSKNISLNSMHYFIMNIPKKRELQQIPFNHSSYIYFKKFMNLSKKCNVNHILF